MEIYDISTYRSLLLNCVIYISVLDSQGQRGAPGDPAKGVKMMMSHLTHCVSS